MKKFFAIAMVFATLLIMLVFLYQHSRYDSWYENREVIEHRVRSGDTLDGLGYEHKPHWMDIREWRYEVCKLNDMKDSDIYAGQIIRIYATRGE